MDLTLYSVKQLRESIKYFSSDECKLNLNLGTQMKKKGYSNIFLVYFLIKSNK